MSERVWRKGNSFTLLVGMQTSTATMENSVDIYYGDEVGKQGMKTFKISITILLVYLFNSFKPYKHNSDFKREGI